MSGICQLYLYLKDFLFSIVKYLDFDSGKKNDFAAKIYLNI